MSPCPTTPLRRCRRSAWAVRPGASDPLWYKDAIIYELHVRAFLDGDDDGVGDFPGLVESSITGRTRRHRAVAAAVLSVAIAR